MAHLAKVDPFGVDDVVWASYSHAGPNKHIRFARVVRRTARGWTLRSIAGKTGTPIREGNVTSTPIVPDLDPPGVIPLPITDLYKQAAAVAARKPIFTDLTGFRNEAGTYGMRFQPYSAELALCITDDALA